MLVYRCPKKMYTHKVNIPYYIYVHIFLGHSVYDMDGNSSHFSTLRTRTEMVLETLIFSPFNHLTRLVARQNFITAMICSRNKWKSTRMTPIVKSTFSSCVLQFWVHTSNLLSKQLHYYAVFTKMNKNERIMRMFVLDPLYICLISETAQ
jgi:hypothetical protein